MCDGHRRNGPLLIAAALMNSPGHGELALSCWVLIDEFDSAHNFSATVHCPCLLRRSNGYAVVRFLVRSTDTQRQTLPRCPLFFNPDCSSLEKLICPLPSECLMNMPYVCMRKCLPMWGGREDRNCSDDRRWTLVAGLPLHFFDVDQNSEHKGTIHRLQCQSVPRRGHAAVCRTCHMFMQIIPANCQLDNGQTLLLSAYKQVLL